MGLSVAIIKEDQIVYSNAFGNRDFARNLPMTTSSMMRIASISKTFTATSILLLKDQGKLDLDKDISDYLGFTIRNPSFNNIPITVRMLASHTSSL